MAHTECLETNNRAPGMEFLYFRQSTATNKGLNKKKSYKNKGEKVICIWRNYECDFIESQPSTRAEVPECSSEHCVL